VLPSPAFEAAERVTRKQIAIFRGLSKSAETVQSTVFKGFSKIGTASAMSQVQQKQKIAASQ
jgi:hypothetical protein